MQDNIIKVGLIIVFALAFTTVFLFIQQLGSVIIIFQRLQIV